MVDSIYLNSFLEEYRGLVIDKVTNEHIKVSGTLRLNHSYDLVPYSEVFKVEISIPKKYPEKLPEIKEVGGKIENSYNHVNYDSTLCLEVEKSMRVQLSPLYNLMEWVEKFVFPFFYSYCYHRDYGKYPFGERSHGAKGILEYYKEQLGIENLEDTRFLMSIVKFYNSQKIYKGHNQCPCGSSEKIRNCHGLENINKITQYIDNQMLKDLRMIEWEEEYFEDKE